MNQSNETKRVPAIEAETHTKWISGLADNSVAVTLRFSNGKELQISEADLSDDIRRNALAHGLKQKLVDAAAISRNPETGRSATIEDKYAAVKKVYDRLLSGMWNEPREGGSTGGLLLQALCRMQPTKTPDQLREWLATKDAKQQAALRLNPKVAAVIEEIKAERANATGVDSDALLDELGE